MNSPSKTSVDFGDTIGSLPNQQVWEYEIGAKRTCHDVAEETFSALETPLEFPPLEAAIVPGDGVAIALDANVASAEGVISGALRLLDQAGAGAIDIVLSDEANESTMKSVELAAGDRGRVWRHNPAHRESLRYIGADRLADPIYLSRWLVDADFVLPITAERALSGSQQVDMTGIFPAFADSRSRHRHQVESSTEGDATESQTERDCCEPAWLLGVQIMLSVAANNRGLASRVLAGTPEAIRKQRTPSPDPPEEFPPAAPLVIASLDGGSQQQSWTNAARAAQAAKQHARPGATIVLWTGIDALPASSPSQQQDSERNALPSAETIDENEEEFHDWNYEETALLSLALIATEHRLLIRSQLDRESIESLGLAAIDSEDELIKLCESFDSCGVLRAAQFAATMSDNLHPFS